MYVETRISNEPGLTFTFSYLADKLKLEEGSFSILRGFEGLGLDRAILWLDPQKLKLSKFPVFYLNLFKARALFKISKERTVNSLYWLLHEPVIFGSCLALSSELS